MEFFMKEFEHLKIQLEDIKKATNNFGNKLIGSGGFGKVYAGEVSHFKGRSMVAIKRLDRRHGQGDPEFWKELMMLFRYTHQNLVALLGYCDEGSEKILVYEHASNGSLDRHLSSTSLTWIQRIKICLDAANGLSYLHDGTGTQQRVLHRDIKSSNILLDENWNAKVSDMGLSKIGPANQQYTAVFTNVVGTPGYCDPLYMETYLLTKESDVYSFGVVLFEVLCGRLCYEISNDQFIILVSKWKKSYEQNKLVYLILQDLKQQMSPDSLDTFSDIAFQCLQRPREKRPMMSLVVEKLETALAFQERYFVKIPKEYEEIVQAAVPTLSYRSLEELKVLLSKGILINNGKTMQTKKKVIHIHLNNTSRFAIGCYLTSGKKFTTRVRTEFLSPLITYTVNLVFKFAQTYETHKHEEIYLEYKLQGETKTWPAYLAEKREDGWLMAELYQFTSEHVFFDFEIIFEEQINLLVVEGIEFQPVEKAKYKVLEDEIVNTNTIPVSYSDTYWEEILPSDYEDIINWSKDSVQCFGISFLYPSKKNSFQWTTKKELFSILCKGFLISNGQWFFLDKNGKKCLMLSARVACEIDGRYVKRKSFHESRFEEVVVVNNAYALITFRKIESHILSPLTTYASYLVYKLTEDKFSCEGPVRVMDKVSDNPLAIHEDIKGQIYFISPQTPVIRPKIDENLYNPSSIPKLKAPPKLRSDGWIEVQVRKFQTDTTTGVIPRHELKASYGKSLSGILIQGIEFRPI